jgi:diguanylate cyclase (GGDEF)-like protein
MDSEENLPISIIMCDVNGLKLINDSFGHSAGDEVLIKIAKIIKECCDKEEVVARLGGDEFVVLLPQTNLQDANKIIDTIKKMLLDEKVVGLNINASFGLDTKENSEQSIVETLQNSENYMYRHKLYEQASTKSDTINIIIKTLFEKSHRESLHSERVSEYCEKIAMALKLNKDEINKIKIAGLVHDIGKIGIREDILNKPGKLNEEEWKEMKKHPEASWRILSSSLEYSEIARYIYEHHEKLDGSGYPRGLKGDEISVEARIIAIADAYDAMTSDRTYRKGLNINEAINEMKKYSGTQFDPDIVNIFIEKLAS